MKIVVIGAAPLGLGAAYRLNELQKNREVSDDIELVVLEKEAYAGGLSCSVKDDKGFLWDMGGHITFNHNFPYYEKVMKESIKRWNKLVRNCQVDLSYLFDEIGIHLVPYPAQYAVPLFPEKIKECCLEELRQRYETENSEIPANFEEWVFQHLGPTIRDVFFRPYSRKVWTVELEEMNPGWVGSRVAMLPREKLEELCSLCPEDLKKVDFGWGPNSEFTFPKYGGTGAVWKAIAKNLPQKWFRYCAEVIEINTKEKEVIYEQKEGEKVKVDKISYDVLVSSAPIDQLIKFTKLCPELKLIRNKVFVIGVGLKLPKPEFVKPFTWLYFPDPAVPFYRVTFLSKYGEVTPDNSKYWSVMCECARKIEDPISEEEIRNLTIEGLVKKSIISKNQIVSVFSILLSYGYPVPSLERDSELTRAHLVLEKNHIYSRGRFGGWKYEASNQDHCFIQGKEVIERIVLNEPEKLYKTGLPLQRG